MNILVVEDEPLMADFIKRGLTAEGHVITVIHDGHEAQAHAMVVNYDIILLDIMLPGQSGLDVCEALRSSGVSTPILMLTALDSVPDRVKGLRQGADDYLVKPYAFDELIARIDAVVRRRTRNREDAVASRSRKMVHGDIEMNRDTMQISRAGHPLSLTAKEIGILELLLERPGNVVSRERILNNVWGIHADPLTNIVEVYIGRLRRKLQEHGPAAIETVRSFGYRLI